MPKDSVRELRDRMDGHRLDLSMSNMDVVPVKDIASLPKATDLDLSCNPITLLPDAFCTLTQLTVLDLSKTNLLCLPQDFGQLDRLVHLDLLGNQLTTLPRSFCQLSRLRWLDLKDNPLEEGLKKNAGDCLDEAQCKKCATRIMMYMTDLDAQLEKQHQAKLKKKRDAEAKIKQREEEEAAAKRAEKRAEKERRRREAEQRRVASVAKTESTDEDVTANKVIISKEPKKAKSKGNKKANKKGSSLAWLWLLLLSIAAAALAFLVMADHQCRAASPHPLCASHWLPFRKQALVHADRALDVASQLRDAAGVYVNQASDVAVQMYETHIKKYL